MISSLKKRKRFIICARSVFSKLALDLKIDPSDAKYVLRRLQQEGIPFITKILPAFSKYALHCCSKEQLLDAREFGLTHFELLGRAPRFMRGLLFEAIDGNADSLYRIRQFCEYFYKAAFDFSKEDLIAAELKYTQTDDSYDREKIDWARLEKVRKVLESGFAGLLRFVPHNLYQLVRPHDGPGAFAQSARVESAYRIPYAAFKRLPGSEIGTHRDHLSQYAGYFKSYPSSPERLKKVSEGRNCELLFVPKDSRGPRTISKEPYFLLKAQMAAGKAIAFLLEKHSHGRIGFTDQTVNQEIARISSKTQEKATADMQEASDRNWLTVCRRLYRNVPILAHAVRLRSDYVVGLPKRGRIKLNKLANMGSGICFPLLALNIFVTSVSALVYDCGYSLKEAMNAVTVYGDDLTIPTECFHPVKDWLESIGFLVNSDKSYFTGYFRESCGADYYHGVDVAPVRFRFANSGLGLVSQYRNGFIPLDTAECLTQANAHVRELKDKCLDSLASYFDRLLERKLGPLPEVARDSPYIGIYTPYRAPRRFTGKVYVSRVKTFSLAAACPYKGLGQSFSSEDGLMQDWSLTPLRRQLNLQRRVPDYSVQTSWGLPYVPEEWKHS